VSFAFFIPVYFAIVGLKLDLIRGISLADARAQMSFTEVTVKCLLHLLLACGLVRSVVIPARSEKSIGTEKYKRLRWE
jgi:Kef-type K+ transport system membrane component KefB